mgnify:CR=1 FL=1
MKLTLSVHEAKCLREAARCGALGDYSKGRKRALQTIYYRLTSMLAGPDDPPSGRLLRTIATPDPGFGPAYLLLDRQENQIGRLEKSGGHWWVQQGVSDCAEGISFGRRRDAVAYLVKLAAKRAAKVAQ